VSSTACWHLYRLVLLNMSKREQRQRTGRERLYRLLPPGLFLSVNGGCRPVLAQPYVQQAGFRHVQRHLLAGRLPSEVVLATR
jgi:hypothetical protein